MHRAAVSSCRLWPPVRAGGSSLSVMRLQRLQAENPSLRGVPFGTDAGPLSATGLSCVVFGPGDIAQAHTKDEWVDLEQVALAAEAYFRIAVELGQSS